VTTHLSALASGESYYRARYYDQNIGRFLSEDKIGNDDGMNLYTYVVNSPVAFRDPTGLYQLVGFPPDKAAQMDSAINSAIQTLGRKRPCSGCAGPAGDKIINALQSATYVYKPDEDDCGSVPPHVWGVHHQINVAGRAFDPICCALASTLAHEASHFAGVASDKDETGGAYDIEKKCFGCGTGHPPPKPPKKPRGR
jgi:RHS repeat-associated protein